MFWGLIMEPNKRYSQTVEKSFHVSMATLDVTHAGDDVVQVTVCYDDTNYLLCTLQKGLVWQVPLDLNFQEGTEIAFTCNGHNRVHLTGYLIPEDDEDLIDELEEEEEEDEEEVPQLVEKQSKRKAIDLPKGRKTKRVKHEAESSEDEEVDLDGTNDDVEDSDDDEEEEGDESLLNEEEDDDDDDEDDDDDDDDDEDEEEEEEKAQKKPNKQQQQQQLQQGKKNKQAQQQQQEQQQKKKQDKQRLLNGKDAKQEQPSNKQQKKNKGEQQQQQQQQKQEQQNAQNIQKKRVVEGGVQIKDIKPGNGAPAKPGRFVSVYYTGRLQNGKKFDATTQGDGFKFRLGKGEVIKGWDVGIAGMKVGGKRQITIPPSMAYGAKGSPPAIPGNSTLVFEVELKNVH